MKRFTVAHIANDDHPIPAWVPRRFADEGIDYVFRDCFTRDDLASCTGAADVLFLTSSRKGLVVEENMDLFAGVGAVIKCGSGTDNIDSEACRRRGIIVAHTPDDPTEPTSDHVIALLFSAVRQTARQDRLVRRGAWDPREALPLARLTGAELGLIGFGRIGRAIVRKLAGFRMRVRVHDPHVGEEAIRAEGCTKAGLDELLASSQLVLVACPLTAETRGLIGRRQLEAMRRDAVLVNGARAGIVDEAALAEALRSGRIRGAGLDVVEHHPLKAGDALLGLENLVLTPHMGGYTPDYPDAVFATSVEVIVGLSRKKMPPWIVNKVVVPKWRMTVEEGQGRRNG